MTGKSNISKILRVEFEPKIPVKAVIKHLSRKQNKNNFALKATGDLQPLFRPTLVHSVLGYISSFCVCFIFFCLKVLPRYERLTIIGKFSKHDTL